MDLFLGESYRRGRLRDKYLTSVVCMYNALWRCHMPIHDWGRIPSGVVHHFHQHWTIEIASALNQGRLPKGLSAMVEQKAGPKEGDVLTVESRRHAGRSGGSEGGGVLTLERPVTSIVRRT